MRIGSCLIPLLALGWWAPAGHAQALTDRSTPAPRTESANITQEERGDILMARKMYREAIDEYKKASPLTHLAYNKIGIAYHQLNELKVARQWYEKSVKSRPTYSEAINNIGTIYYAQKNYRRAITQYQKALEIAPNSASIHSNLGTAFFARKKYQEAVSEYEIAMKLDPEVFERHSNAGSLLMERNVQERAKFHYYLAKMYAKSGNVELSLQYMRKALEEGFKEKQKFTEEEEFAAVRKHPDFEILMKMEPRVL
jgi:tetratricopeptide (TPR) repeat protein